ncbi:hypothetical protein GCM10022232_05890 [Streptomyces plumbiresistens]|uniref:Uncharacterized protein n=1 Tax=Streptomyces plumbiresistens TaxID=511811 RepID=A0ABP7Q5S7_9ACTN
MPLLTGAGAKGLTPTIGPRQGTAAIPLAIHQRAPNRFQADTGIAGTEGVDAGKGVSARGGEDAAFEGVVVAVAA